MIGPQPPHIRILGTPRPQPDKTVSDSPTETKVEAASAQEDFSLSPTAQTRLQGHVDELISVLKMAGGVASLVQRGVLSQSRNRLRASGTISVAEAFSPDRSMEAVETQRRMLIELAEVSLGTGQQLIRGAKLMLGELQAGSQLPVAEHPAEKEATGERAVNPPRDSNVADSGLAAAPGRVPADRGRAADGVQGYPKRFPTRSTQRGPLEDWLRLLVRFYNPRMTIR